VSVSGDRHSAAAAREEPPILALLADLKTAIASRILVVLCATAIAFCVLGAVLVAIVDPGATTRWVALILGLLATLSALELWRTARPWAGLRVFYALVALALGYAILENGGIDAPAFHATIPLTLALAFAFRPRVAGIAVALVVAWTVFVEWAKRAGVIASAPPLAPWARITAGAMKEAALT